MSDFVPPSSGMSGVRYFFFTDGSRQIWGGFAVWHSFWWPPSVKAGHTVAVAPPVVLASCLLSGFVFISPTFVCEKPILNTLPCFRNWLGKGLVIQAIDHLRGTSPSVYCFYVGEDSLSWTLGLKSGTNAEKFCSKARVKMCDFSWHNGHLLH